VNESLIFHQLFDKESSTYTYLIGDAQSKKAALIDPVLEWVERDLQLVQELGLKLVYVLDTHIHADHITGASVIRERTQAKTAVSAASGVACADLMLNDGQELELGPFKIRAISTPGHTDTCMSFYVAGRLFSGDALLIRGNGRTDFQQGSSEKLFESVRRKLFSLPDSTAVYPAHDYNGHTSSSIGEEKRWNRNLNESISLEQFREIMAQKKLAPPKRIQEAVPANLACGRVNA
jgi:glyoxylase-like metal-dependent hydrolase (beta-lactamase superfamily II)